MSCVDTRRYLDTYLDGELDAEALIDVERHLASCAACGASATLRSRLKSELRELGEVRAPDTLRRRIEALPTRRARSRRWMAVAAVPVAAAAALVIALLPIGHASDKELSQIVMEDLVQRHSRPLPMEVRDHDPLRAASWFEGKVDFPVHPPRLGIKNASFEGARLSNVRSSQAAHMTYLVDGHRVTLMIFNPRHADLTSGRKVRVGGHEVLVGDRNGYHVAVLIKDGLAYAFSSDLPEQRLLALVGSISR